LSQERVITTLLSLGLTEIDAKVYVFLAKMGLQRALDMHKSMKMNKEQLYRSLRKLQSKGLVTATMEHPARFSAVPFEKVLDLFIKTKLEEAHEVQKHKDEILSIWKSMAIEENDPSAKFTIIEGRTTIYSKIQQMIQETKTNFSAILTTSSLLRANQHGLFDSTKKASEKDKEIRFLTELSPQYVSAMKGFLQEIKKNKLPVKGRITESSFHSFPRIVLRDEEEVIFFISPNAGSDAEQDTSCLWTNSKTLVQAFAVIFENLWSNALEVETRIAELENEKIISIEQKLESSKEIQLRYLQALQNAQQEIILITSEEGLLDLSKKSSQLISAAIRGVNVRIMAPIVDTNLVAAKRLAKLCQIRHVASDELETTIIDGKHLFQQNSSSKMTGSQRLRSLKHTDDFDYVDKMKIKLDDYWKNAAPPLFIQWELGIGRGKSTPLHSSYYSDTKMSPNSNKPKGISQKGELSKAVFDSMTLKSWRKETSNGYGVMGQAIIQLPSSSKMPTIGLRVVHFDPISGFGEGNNMTIHLWLETPPGYSMVPVAVLADSPKEALINQQLLAGTPAAQNIIVTKPNQFQIMIKEKVLFAGWTIDIPLPSLHVVLGSSTLILKGLGTGRRLVRDYVTPGGFKGRMEFTSYHAQTTFMNKSSFYVGAGIQGSLAIDCIFATKPP
jgi:HTH-type transcriptional regulator, sugar sensing transcriptional regulator